MNNDMVWLDQPDIQNYPDKITKNYATLHANSHYNSEEFPPSLNPLTRPFNNAIQSQDNIFSLVNGSSIGRGFNNQNFSFSTKGDFQSQKAAEIVEDSFINNRAFINRDDQNTMINCDRTTGSLLSVSSPGTDQASITSLENVNNLIKASRLLSGELNDFHSNWTYPQQFDYNRVSPLKTIPFWPLKKLFLPVSRFANLDVEEV